MSTTRSQNHQPSSTTPPPPSPPLTTPKSRSQRLFTEGDEIRLLQSFLKLTKSKANNQNSSPPPTTTAIDSHTLDRIKKSLNSDLTHNQVSDKLRRLRQKYHKQARSKSLMKTPHDRRIHEIARKIWGKNKSQAQENPQEEEEEEEEEEEDLCDDDVVVASEEEKEEVGLKGFPELVSEFSKYLPGNEVWKEGLKGLEEGKLREMNEEWRVLQIEEAKVVARKVQLFQQQVKVVLELVGPSSSS